MAEKTSRRSGCRRIVSASYLRLIRAFPLRPLRSEEELDEAIDMLDRLLARTEPLDEQEQDYLESLSHEIERYEDSTYPMPAVSGADMLSHLLEAHEQSLSAVSSATRIAVSTLSEVLRGKRRLNLAHIKKLAAHFGVEPAVFLD